MTAAAHDAEGSSLPVRIPVKDLILYGDLRRPANPKGLVIFVHGSGSSRFSPRNRYVAEEFNNAGLATLLMDLLTEDEQRIDDETRQYRFDIPLLGARSTLAAIWAQRQPETGSLPIGLFGASTGAAAALITAAAMKRQIAAVVSRGGRPDLAQEVLAQIESPTLLIVGGEDETVLALNKKAAAQMRCVSKIHVVPRATHLFEEPGALKEVVTVAAEWFIPNMQKAVAGEKIG
jgi:dienelactone hydrolase